MKRILWSVVTLTLGIWTLGAEGAAPTERDLDQILERLEALTSRVDKLERQNANLAAENQALKAAGERLVPGSIGVLPQAGEQHQGAAESSISSDKREAADWASRVVFKGDLRYRLDETHDEAPAADGTQAMADRFRHRIRARVGLEAKATDSIRVGVQFVTAENGDPASGNQTLDGVFSRKAVDLDLAYLDWAFTNWGHAIAGKMKMPFFRPGQSMFWDNDINPEGIALTFGQGAWFGSAYNFWLDEVSGPETALTADSMMSGVQVGRRLSIGDSNLVLAAHYYDLSAAQGRRGIFFNCSPTSNSCANGNTVSGSPGAGVLAFDFRVLNLAAELNTTLGRLPLQFWADAARNADPDDLNTAWAAGFLLGETSQPRGWEAGAFYQVLEKDSLFAQFIDSEWGGRSTDGQGVTFKAGYSPRKNWIIDLTYFHNQRNVEIGPKSDYDRWMLDFNLKF